ncbi:MAG: cysteine desulfurase [Candidatus Moraniibacteriota bacterium]|nr:MAG: cysteine desulfurase [Candidatus Moranbacteria bacterium]
MNIHNFKKCFAIFDKNPDFIYLDSAATSLTPKNVVEKITSYYKTSDANIARGVYKTSVYATTECEKSRETVAQFLSAQKNEIIFTSGTTESLNMIAHGLQHLIETDNEILTTKAEHHANFIPWQILAKNTQAHFTTLSLNLDGTIDVEKLCNVITPKTKIIALTHISNVLGTINPIKTIIAKIRAINPQTIIVIDAAQSIAHTKIDVRDIDCDFLAFSFHKLFGPTGLGVLYGKKTLLKKLTPLCTGGEMIEEVTSKCTTYRTLPHRLEAGTPNIAGIISAQEAIHFINNIGYDQIHAHEQSIVTYCIEQLLTHFHNNITIIGPKSTKKRSNIISFTLKNCHPHDIATILDEKYNIAIRAGQHCAMPLHLEELKIPATARISISLHNTKEDIDKLIKGLKEASSMLL